MPIRKLIPDKFRLKSLSFLSKIEKDAGKTSLSSFCVFPNGVNFQGKDKNESVVLLIRQDPASLISSYLTVLLFLVSPFFFFAVLRVMGVDGVALSAFSLGSGLLFLLLAITSAFDTFIKWYYSVNIVTDERIVDVDFSNVLYHRYSETQLEKVEDVTHNVAGLWASIFDYGNVFVQTAAAMREFEFTNVPRPRDIQDTILDLLELKQEGKI